MVETTNSYEGHEDCMSEVFFENEEQGFQYRLTVSEFRGRLYFGIRKWMVDINEDWFPTREGFTIPYNIQTTGSLFSALTKILSEGEVLHEVLESINYKAHQD